MRLPNRSIRRHKSGEHGREEALKAWYYIFLKKINMHTVNQEIHKDCTKILIFGVGSRLSNDSQ